VGQQVLLTQLLDILWHINSCANLKRDCTKFQIVKCSFSCVLL